MGYRIAYVVVALKMLADAHGLLDQVVEIFWDLWSKTCIPR
jgi:hypothetical protein